MIRTPGDGVTAGVSALFVHTQGWLEALVPRVVAAPGISVHSMSGVEITMTSEAFLPLSMLGVRKGESSEVTVPIDGRLSA